MGKRKKEKHKNEGKQETITSKLLKELPIFSFIFLLNYAVTYIIRDAHIPTDERALTVALLFLSFVILITLMMSLLIFKENGLLGIKAWFILIDFIIISSLSFYLWYALIWSNAEDKSAAFTGLTSALAFLGLIITILVQIYQHKKNTNMASRTSRVNYLTQRISSLLETKKEIIKYYKEDIKLSKRQPNDENINVEEMKRRQWLIMITEVRLEEIFTYHEINTIFPSFMSKKDLDIYKNSLTRCNSFTKFCFDMSIDQQEFDKEMDKVIEDFGKKINSSYRNI